MFWFIVAPHEIVGRSLHKPRRPRAAAGRRHSCAMVGQHRPASPGWRRRRGAAHPASGRLVRPRRMPPTMGSRLRREGGAGQRRCPSRCQQRARRCACPAVEVVAQRPHGCVARRRAGREHPEPARVLVTTVVPLHVGKHCNSGSFAPRREEVFRRYLTSLLHVRSPHYTNV